MLNGGLKSIKQKISIKENPPYLVEDFDNNLLLNEGTMRP